MPLPGKPGAPFRSSLVWVMSEAEAARRGALGDAALAGVIHRQARALLGAMTIEGARGLFPMSRQSARSLVATRLALIGDAAHAFPPIGAQGLNLGLRDVEGHRDRARGESHGLPTSAAPRRSSAMRTRRRSDIALRSAAVDGLNRALLAHLPPIDALRGLGLAALAGVGPLRRW